MPFPPLAKATSRPSALRATAAWSDQNSSLRGARNTSIEAGWSTLQTRTSKRLSRDTRWRLSPDQAGEDFHGAVVGLGAVGVVTKVTLAIGPAFTMRQWVYEDLPLAQMTEHFDAIQASGYSVSFFWDWQRPRINAVWIKSRVDAATPFDAPARFHGATRAAKNPPLPSRRARSSAGRGRAGRQP